MLTFRDYLGLVRKEMENHPEWRIGQTFFNVLQVERPDLAARVRGVHLDPFYRDEKIVMFLDYIDYHWTLPKDEAEGPTYSTTDACQFCGEVHPV